MEKNTKLQVVDKLQQITNQIESYFTDGHVSGKDALLLYGGVKALANKMDDLSKKDNIKEIIIKEFDSYGEKTVIVEGLKFSKRNFTRYDYSDVNHPLLIFENFITSILKKYIEPIKDKAKNISKSQSVSPDKTEVLTKKRVLEIKDLINDTFDDILSEFGDNELIVFDLNPAKSSSSESIIVQKVK